MTVELPVKFVTHTCCAAGCHIAFAVPAEWDQQKRRDHSSFYCPNGHRQRYTGESDLEKAERLRKEAERRESERVNSVQAQLNETRHALEVAKRQAAIEKGKLTRHRNRVNRGVCPCCTRTFQNLARHIETQHPEQLDPAHERKQITAGGGR